MKTGNTNFGGVELTRPSKMGSESSMLEVVDNLVVAKVSLCKKKLYSPDLHTESMKKLSSKGAQTMTEKKFPDSNRPVHSPSTGNSRPGSSSGTGVGVGSGTRTYGDKVRGTFDTVNTLPPPPPKRDTK